MEDLDLNSQAKGFPQLGSYQEFLQAEQNLFDKANWTEENTHIFCDVVVEQIRAGNCLNGTMSGRGYKEMRRKKPKCKKFMYGVSTYVDQLGEMFHGVTVDGSTSCIPGQGTFDPEERADEEGEDADGEGFVNSPMSSNSRKRTSSSTSTASSPLKKSKSPMLKMFRGCLKS
ncbi:uncharacterized protein [Miscanthus floridulus]|uniref:uncharacterized protein n=1 Tax=Miscanthus floridulus TaxID=154761 RepID=UPI0034578F18